MITYFEIDILFLISFKHCSDIKKNYTRYSKIDGEKIMPDFDITKVRPEQPRSLSPRGTQN